MYVLIFVKGCCQLAFRMQTPPWLGHSPRAFDPLHTFKSFRCTFLFWEERTFFIATVAQSVTDLEANRVKSVARFDRYVNFILVDDNSTLRLDFEIMVTYDKNCLEPFLGKIHQYEIQYDVLHLNLCQAWGCIRYTVQVTHGPVTRILCKETETKEKRNSPHLHPIKNLWI